MRGSFITFEGSDGSGKTTMVARLAEQLRSDGYEVLTTREPGGTEVGNKLRDIIVNSDTLTPIAGLLLLGAARAEHIDKVIRPALAEGKIVICDRFTDSSFAYQGARYQLMDEVQAITDMVCGGLVPDRTLYLDLTVAEAVKRLNARPEEKNKLDDTTMEFRKITSVAYHLRYLAEANMPETPDVGRIRRIDASGDEESVFKQILHWYSQYRYKLHKADHAELCATGL